MDKLRNTCILSLIFLICACSASTSARVLQNKFAFPNSDLSPLGTVHAEASKTSFLTDSPMDKDRLDGLMRDALQQKGGDTLVDYVLTTQVVFLPPIPVYFMKYTLDGTAVKVVEIGRQELH